MLSRELIQLSDSDYKILYKIKEKYETDFNFFVFGSRVKNKAKRYSDLDIAYEKLTNQPITQFRNEIEDSNFSLTLDLVNLNEVDEAFQELIRSEMLPL